MTALAVAGAALAATAALRTTAPRPAAAAWLPTSAPGSDLLLTTHGTGWAVVNGVVERSADDGATFVGVTPHTVGRCGCLGDVDFVGDRTAVAVEDGRTVRTFETTDGGGRWTPGAPLPGLVGEDGVPQLDGTILFEQLAFATPSRGVLLGVGATLSVGESSRTVVALWTTDDGGRRWTLEPLRSTPGNGTVTTFDNPCGHAGSWSAGIDRAGRTFLAETACGASRPVLDEQSAGGTFHALSLPAPPGGWPRGATTGSSAGVDVGAPQFVSAGTAYLPVTVGTGRLLVYATTDGGRRFALRSVLDTGEAVRPAGFDAVSASLLALPASDGTWFSTDGGRTFHLVASPVSLTGVVGASFASATTGLVLDGGLFKTDDAGVRWSGRIPVTTGSGVQALAFSSPTTGVVGGAHDLFPTVDGGRRFATVRVPTLADEVTEVDPTSPAGGLVVTGHELFASSDSWRHLTPLAEPAAGALDTVEAFGSAVVYGAVCGSARSRSLLLRSDDAGRSWQVVGLPTASPGTCLLAPDPAAASTGSAADLCFSSATTGWFLPPVATSAHLETTTLYETTNGGRSWAARSRRAPSLPLLACAGGRLFAEQAQLTGMSWSTVRLFTSTGGSGPWREVASNLAGTGPLPLPPGTAVEGPVGRLPGAEGGSLVDLAGRDLVYVGECEVCTDLLSFATSSDGGARWQSVRLSEPSPIDRIQFGSLVDFTDPDHGFVAGSEGAGLSSRLCSTSDGGRRWRLVATLSSPG